MMAGCIFVSKLSLDDAVHMKSSAYRIKLTFSPLWDILWISCSSPSSVIFARVGEAMPPYAKKVIMQSKLQNHLAIQ